MQAAAQIRGRLRLYLGAAPGVGKTYAMLHEGRRRRDRGTDVVVGFAETYNRPLTVEALEGMEVIPRKRVEYQGVVLEEMDTDAVIARHPQVALVDELAHTNAPGSKHEKRWQDIEEIRDAGITVISTLNIQHLESLNDVVAGITGIKVRETVPDRVVDDADEVEVVDISPEALQARMRHGNIYPPDQAQRALQGFFRAGNLAALRELVLKRVALEVEQQLHEYMHEHRLEGWEAGERVLVLLDNTPASEVAIRRAWRLAHAFNGELFAAYPAPLLREQGMTHILTVALDLNATTREIPGGDLAAELSALITAESVTHVTLLARPAGRFSLRPRRALAEQLLTRHPHLDVHLVRAEPR
ncbi:MAG: sensor histidine kinase KdpD [Dehalococcoidia bacterium]|nr:sensor histidine kinase KdpD [Dehalococcoidia bacterium]